MTSAQGHITYITQDIPLRYLKLGVDYNIRRNVVQLINEWAHRNHVTINPEEELDLYIKSKEPK